MNKFQLTEEELENLIGDFAPPENHSGFDTKEDALEYLDSLLNWTYKYLPEEVTLWRILFINSEEDFKSNDLGKHWIIDPDNLHDNDWIERIRETNDNNDEDIEPIVIMAKFKFNDIDQLRTLQNNLLYPDEEEITIIPGRKPIEFKLYKLEELRRKDLKKLRRLNIK